jgi:PEP-CTERM motif
MHSGTHRFHFARRSSSLSLAAVAAFCFTGVASADLITFGGLITQSTADTGNQAVNNPGLNSIVDGDAYSVTLNYNGSITAPGTYTNFQPPVSCLAASVSSAACFSDSAAPASETAFAAISLTITANADGIHDDFSLLGCLTTGSGCAVGNQLDANFEILAANLRSPSAPAVGLDQPHPLDLLEDDGITDIQGTIASYSYAAQATTVPEPASLALVGLALASLAGKALARKAIAQRFRRR